MGQRLEESGWTMSGVLVLNLGWPPAPKIHMDLTTASILRMWLLTAMLLVILIEYMHRLLDSANHSAMHYCWLPYVHRTGQCYPHTSKIWWPETGAEWNLQQFLHTWSSGGLLRWTVGDCVWWLLVFNKHSCGLSSTWVSSYLQYRLDHK